MNWIAFCARFALIALFCVCGLGLFAQDFNRDSTVRDSAQIGFEKEIEVQLDPGNVLRKRVLSGDPPVWIRLWKKENQAYGVAFTVLENGTHDLNDYWACFDAQGREIPFSYVIRAQGLLSDKDDGHVAPVHPINLFPHAFWTPLRILYAVFAVWSLLFLSVLVVKIYRFFRRRMRHVRIVDLPPESLYERIETLLNRTEPSLSLSEQDELYLLVLSAWAAREHWGKHVLVASLYPHIHAQNHYEMLHRTLENWLYAHGAAPDFEVLKTSCKPLDSEGGRC